MAAVSVAWPPAAPLAFASGGFVSAGLVLGAPALEPGLALPLQGRVVSMPRQDDGRARYLLEAPDGARVELSSPDLAAPLALWDEIRATADLREIGVARNPGARDPALAAGAHGVAARAWTRTPPARAAPPSPLSPVALARIAFGREASRILPPREAALVRAIGAGDESAVDDETRARFARSGLAHVLSVSGLHLAVVALGAFRLLAALLLRVEPLSSRFDVRRLAALAALPVTLLYAVATGASVPVVRSAVGTGLVFAAALLGRRPDAGHALGLAALAILAHDPGAVLDVSFQLSFASVAGLLLLAGPIRRAVPWRARRPGLAGRALEAMLQGAAASAAATVATAPLLALHFRRISTLALPANAAGLPVASALTVLAALAFLTSAALPPLGPALLWLCRPFATAFLALNDAFAAPAFASVGIASPGWPLVAAAWALGGAAVLTRGRARWALAAAAALAVVLPGPARWLAARHRDGIEVIFLSVGQGDCTIVRLPDGSGVVIDAGGDPAGRYDPGARDVLPFLRDMGILRLAAAFVSHPHPDHLQGLPAVVLDYGEVPVLASFDRGDAAARAAFARMSPARTLAAGDEVDLSGVRFRVLGPPRESHSLVENDASLVLHVTYGESSFLLPGDVEAAGEAALLAAGVPRVDVVKAPHHGSRTSSGRGLVRGTRPRFVVFPVGAGNRYGFPHAETVARWRESGAVLARTDEGPVRFRSDGRRTWRADPADALDAWELLGGR